LPKNSPARESQYIKEPFFRIILETFSLKEDGCGVLSDGGDGATI